MIACTQYHKRYIGLLAYLGTTFQIQPETVQCFLTNVLATLNGILVSYKSVLMVLTEQCASAKL